jgi:hypothetical protein
MLFLALAQILTILPAVTETGIQTAVAVVTHERITDFSIRIFAAASH